MTIFDPSGNFLLCDVDKLFLKSAILCDPIHSAKNSPEEFSEIAARRDVFVVHLMPPHAKKGEDRDTAAVAAPYVCPVTDLPCTRYPFVALPSCGHAFSSRAVAQACFHP